MWLTHKDPRTIDQLLRIIKRPRTPFFNKNLISVRSDPRSEKNLGPSCCLWVFSTIWASYQFVYLGCLTTVNYPLPTTVTTILYTRLKHLTGKNDNFIFSKIDHNWAQDLRLGATVGCVWLLVDRVLGPTLLALIWTRFSFTQCAANHFNCIIKSKKKTVART